MSEYEYDLVVIGAGSGGVRAARMSGGFGARVAIIEEQYWGGTCVNVGCVPKKLYYYASHMAETFEDAAGYGWHLDEPNLDWPTLRDNKSAEISRLNGIYKNLLDNTNVHQIEGRASVVDEHTVRVGEQTLSAERILIATGGWPFIPEFPGREHAINSNQIFDLPALPERMVVVGGGYIAVEFAAIFAGLGVSVHLVYRGQQFLKHFDSDIGQAVTDELRNLGGTLHLETNVTSITGNTADYMVHLDNESAIQAGVVLYATGRKPNLTGLGLDELGVKLNASGFVDVDDYYQTNIPSVYAVGDVIGGPELTPVALAEGMVLARHLYGEGSDPLDYDNIPTAIFTQPNAATVGLTESEAKERFESVGIYKSQFRHLKHTLSGNPAKTTMKLVVDQQSDRVLGVHMVGDDAGEIVQGLAVALKAGVTKKILDSTIGIHPTAAEEFVTMREAVS